MATINTYLVFRGNCEEAFEFYKSVFGDEFPYKGRYKDAPPTDKQIVYSMNFLPVEILKCQ